MRLTSSCPLRRVIRPIFGMRKRRSKAGFGIAAAATRSARQAKISTSEFRFRGGTSHEPCNIHSVYFCDAATCSIVSSGASFDGLKPLSIPSLFEGISA